LDGFVVRSLLDKIIIDAMVQQFKQPLLIAMRFHELLVSRATRTIVHRKIQARAFPNQLGFVEPARLLFNFGYDVTVNAPHRKRRCVVRRPHLRETSTDDVNFIVQAWFIDGALEPRHPYDPESAFPLEQRKPVAKPARREQQIFVIVHNHLFRSELWTGQMTLQAKLTTWST
jgi:hypothetical protein